MLKANFGVSKLFFFKQRINNSVHINKVQILLNKLILDSDYNLIKTWKLKNWSYFCLFDPMLRFYTETVRLRQGNGPARFHAGIANSRDMCRLSIKRNSTNIRLIPGESEEILPSCVFEIPRRYLPWYRSVDTVLCLCSTQDVYLRLNKLISSHVFHIRFSILSGTGKYIDI